MAENQLMEDWLRAARTSDYDPHTAAQFAATVALAEGVKWIGESLAELVEMVKDDDRIVKLLLALAGKQFDRNIVELKEMLKESEASDG